MKRIVFLIIFLAALGTGAYYCLPPLILHSQPVEEILTRRVEQMTGARLEGTSMHYSYFPSLAVNLEEAVLSAGDPVPFRIESSRLEIALSRWALLFGRVNIRRVSVNDGILHLGLQPLGINDAVEIRDLRLNLWSTGSEAPLRASLEGGLNGSEKAIEAEFVLNEASFDPWDWNALGFEASLSLEAMNILDLKPLIRKWFSVQVRDGQWGGQWHFRKESATPLIGVGANIHLDEFVYRLSGGTPGMTSPPITANSEIAFTWDPETEFMDLKKLNLKMPMGRIAAAGTLALGTRELQNFRLTASNITLENIPQYFINLKEVIPLNIGFSGQSSFELSLSGTWDQLSFHANWDLSQALLTYARYFSKPKGEELNITFDYLLKDLRYLGGDFAAHFKDVSMKGNLTDVDLETGSGQMNLITNKFSLAGWQALIPPLEKYELEGRAKMLANFKGDLRNPFSSPATFNLSLENARIQGPEGYSIHDANLAMDISPLSLEVREANFRVGDFPVDAGLTLYGRDDFPVFRFNLNSEQLDVLFAFRTLRDLFGNWTSPDIRRALDSGQGWLENLAPEGTVFEGIRLETEFEKGVFNIPVFRLQGYGGEVSLRGKWNFLTARPHYGVDLTLQKLSLARFGRRTEETASLADGNLFLKGRLEGELPEDGSWKNHLRGEGDILVTNGEFHTFDILGTVSQLSDFSEIAGSGSGGTLFHDFRSHLKVESQKIKTEKIVMLADFYTVEGNGEISFSGSLNHRLNVFLDKSLFSREVSTDNPISENDYVGPVPLLLAGPIENPELKPDSGLIPSLAASLFGKKKPQTNLDNFLSEDFFAIEEAASS